MSDDSKMALCAVPTGLATLWLVSWVFHVTVPSNVWWGFPYCITLMVCGAGVWFLACTTLWWLTDDVIPGLLKSARSH